MTTVSEEKPSLAGILHKNRAFVLAMLGVPVIGMAIAFVLVLIKKPDNMLITLAVTFFLAVQYILLMFFWMKRVEKLASREKQDAQDIEEVEPSEVELISLRTEKMLAPEEERVFPEEKNQG